MTIKTPTTLVLGAASSTHCGYPLGIQLINEIAQSHASTHQIPLPHGWSEIDRNTLITRLSRSGHYSIDAFLEDTKEFTEIGKYLIAATLKKNEDIARLFPPHDSGWYQYLFNSLLGTDKRPFAENALNIVTFNYDRSLEAYLFHALIARFGYSNAEAAAELAKVPIHHVHGSLGSFPETPYEKSNDPDLLSEIAKGINIIHEIDDKEGGFCNLAFQNANKSIERSRKVVFLGFGFHYDNVRRLAVDWQAKQHRELFSTFWDTSAEEYARIIDRLLDFGITKRLLPIRGGHDCNNFFRFATSLS